MRGPAGGFGRRVVVAIPFLWLAAFTLLPFAIVLKISLSEAALAQPPYRPVFTPDTWRAFLAGLGPDRYRTLLSDPLYAEAVASSLRLAGIATAIVVPAGTALALAVARAPARIRAALVAALVLPFWTSFLVRVYAWIAILKTDGWLNGLLLRLGLVRAPLEILNTEAAVLIGLVYAYLPFMVLPVYAALDRQDPALLEAAADLGASPLRRFWTLTVPLSWPGIAAGALLCFIPMVGEFVIPELLGGSDTLMVGAVLWAEFFPNKDWPLAAAVAVALLALLLVPIVLLREVEERRGTGAP